MKTQALDTETTPLLSDKDLRKLLLKFVLSEGPSSVAAFDAWETHVVFDDSSIQSFTLLPAVYLKLLRHDLTSRLFLRIKGAHRRTWTENQLLLTELNDLFADLNTRQLKFVITDESIRLTEIYKDPGIFPLQNFSILTPLSQKREFCRVLIGNRWEIRDDAVGQTQWKKDKALAINTLWTSDEGFAEQSEDVDTIPVGNSFASILSPERQILNLCKNRFLTQGDEESSWQFVGCALFNAGKIDSSQLTVLAQRRHLSHQMAQMLESLAADYELEVPPDLLTELRKSPKPGRISLIEQRFQNLRHEYQMYLESEPHPLSQTGPVEFLAKRWEVDSFTAMAKHGVRSCIRLFYKRDESAH